MFRKTNASIPKLSLRAFSAAVAQSVCKANEMLEQDHLEAMLFYAGQAESALPPPAPLMIRSARVKFSGGVSQAGSDRGAGELQIDLAAPEGNFSAELEFQPFSEELLQELLRSREAPPPPPQWAPPQPPSPPEGYQPPVPGEFQPAPEGYQPPAPGAQPPFCPPGCIGNPEGPGYPQSDLM